MKIVIGNQPRDSVSNKEIILTEAQRKIAIQFIAAHNSKIQKMMDNGTYEKWLNKN